MTPGMLAPRFQLDGEYAFDAAGYELWWELAFAIIVGAMAWVVPRRRQFSTIDR
jgi:hypothetical protein